MAAETLETADRLLAEALSFGELAIPREYTITRDGREYILSDGLLHGLVQLSRGYYDLATEIVQRPTAENAQTAICTAKVTIFEPESGRVLRTATGIGDASPANTGRLVAPHVLRMAETRAVARALRHLLGVGLTALEELGAGGPEEAPSKPPEAPWGPPAKPEEIEVEGRRYTRPAVLKVYRLRLEEAQKAGLAVPSDDAGLPEDAPLSMLVGVAQSIRKRLDAREGK